MSQSYFVSFSLSHQKFMSFQIPLFGSGNQLILFAIRNEVWGVDFVGFILMLDVIECYSSIAFLLNVLFNTLSMIIC